MHGQKTMTLDEGYRAMAADEVREAEAIEWIGALGSDIPNDEEIFANGIETLSYGGVKEVEEAIKVQFGLPK